jgi:hypothetical protein
VKKQTCQDFIERNRSQLWKYDLSYLKKTPRTICNELINDTNYVGLMTKNRSKERVLALSGSENTMQCFATPVPSAKTLSNDTYVNFHKRSSTHLSEKRHDPFLASITTTRELRNQRASALFQPSYEACSAQYHRGFNHEPEYGTFSKYNAVLKANENALMKR